MLDGEPAEVSHTIPHPLPATGTVDVCTTGRRSGQRRWFETWFVYVTGELVLTGTPGRRHWLANLQAHPEAIVRFRDPLVEVPVVAQVVSDLVERRRLVPLIWEAQPWYADQGYSVDDWVCRAPMALLAARRP